MKNPWVVVRQSKLHHKGLFAKRDIPKKTPIIEYVGDLVTKMESQRRATVYLENAKKVKNQGGVYIFTHNKRYDLDGNVFRNIARFANHSCEPNAEVFDIKGKTIIEAKRLIRKGEEISYDYGFGITEYWDHPCRCGSSRCVGYIVDRRYHKRLKDRIQKDKKSAPAAA